MFENFEEFRNRKMPGWVIPVLIAAVVAHVAVFGVVVFNEMWAAPLLDVPVGPRGCSARATACGPPWARRVGRFRRAAA